jgi:hypothetical protein
MKKLVFLAVLSALSAGAVAGIVPGDGRCGEGEKVWELTQEERQSLAQHDIKVKVGSVLSRDEDGAHYEVSSVSSDGSYACIRPVGTFVPLQGGVKKKKGNSAAGQGGVR